MWLSAVLVFTSLLVLFSVGAGLLQRCSLT